MIIIIINIWFIIYIMIYYDIINISIIIFNRNLSENKKHVTYKNTLFIKLYFWYLIFFFHYVFIKNGKK